MGFKDAGWAYNLNLPTTQKVVLAAVAFRTDDRTHQTIAGQQTVATMLGMNRATVNRSLGLLESAGIITRTKRSDAYGHRKTDTITCNTNVTLTNVGPANVGETNVSDSASQRDSHDEPMSPSSTAVDVIQKDHPVGHPVLPRASFADFWIVWPRSEDKKRAETAWARAIKRADPDRIVAIATAYANHPHRPPKQFVKHAATWLNGDCWNDPMPSAPEIDNRRQTTGDRNLTYLANLADRQNGQKGITA